MTAFAHHGARASDIIPDGASTVEFLAATEGQLPNVLLERLAEQLRPTTGQATSAVSGAAVAPAESCAEEGVSEDLLGRLADERGVPSAESVIKDAQKGE